jgi:hypothetical protein
MSVQNYMKTFAPAPKPVQTAAKRTGADRLTAGQVNRIVDKLRLQTWPSEVLASTLYEERLQEDDGNPCQGEAVGCKLSW